MYFTQIPRQSVRSVGRNRSGELLSKVARDGVHVLYCIQDYSSTSIVFLPSYCLRSKTINHSVIHPLMTWWHYQLWHDDMMTQWHDDRKLRRRLTVWDIYFLALPLYHCALTETSSRKWLEPSDIGTTHDSNINKLSGWNAIEDLFLIYSLQISIK